MKSLHLSSTKGQYLNCKLLLLLLCTPLIAIAQAPTGIMWDSAVGCQEKVREYYFDVENSGECIKTCQNSTVAYILVGDPTPWINVQWIVNGGTVQNPTNQNVTVLWGTQQYGEIIIKIETLDEIFIRTICVELISPPYVDFIIFPNGPRPRRLVVCKDEIVYFENLSQSVGSSPLIFYNWYFPDDNTTSAAFEPTHIFQQNGIFQVELTVSNACNCTATSIIEVEVLDEGLVIECNSIACENEVMTYTVTDVGGDSVYCKIYKWVIDGGSIISQNHNEVQVKWDNIDGDGYGYVTFDPNSCDVACAISTTIKVPVIKDDIEIKGPAKICANEQVRFSIPLWPTTEVSWKVSPSPGLTILPSDQPNEVIITGNIGGDYLLEAIYNNTIKGCGGVAFKEIEITAVESIVGPKIICVNTIANYTTISGIAYDWQIQGPTTNDFGAGTTLQYTFSEPGLHTIYIGQIDCQKPEPFTVLVKPLPDAPAAIDGPLEICPGVPVTYSVVPSPSGSGQAVWRLQPGFGMFASTLNDQAVGDEVTVIWNPNFTRYELRVHYESGGCEGPPLVIEPKPLIVDYNFTGSQTTCSSSYETYSVDYLEGDKYEWRIITPDLGSIAEYPQDHEIQVLWNNVTTTTTAILELSLEKCGSTFTKQYSVIIEPTIPISINAPTTACRGESINFSLYGLSSYTDVRWDFGDGTIKYGPTQIHSYNFFSTTVTNYVVEVTVTGPNGCILPATDTVPISIIPVPMGILTTGPTIFCDQNDFNINKTPLVISTNPPTTTTDYSSIIWFGPNTNNIPPLTTSIIPSQTGNYYAKITYLNTGCTETTNPVLFRIRNCTPPSGCSITETPPIITNAYLTACNTLIATAQRNSSTTPLDYRWKLDDLVQPNQSYPSATFNVFGAGWHTITYEERYAGLDSNGDPCTAYISGSESFFVPYEAHLKYSFTCNSAGTGYDVTIYDASIYYPQPIPITTEYIVNGVPQQATNQPQHTVTLSPGMHTLGLEISGYSTLNNIPIICTTTESIILPDLPTAIINAPTEACAGVPVPFSATVNDPNLTYWWDFGDQAENSLPAPIRNFEPSLVDRIVSLTVTNIHGCSVTVTHPITIKSPDMAGSLSLNPPTACYGNGITIFYNPPNNQSSNIITYFWNREVNGLPVGNPQQTPGPSFLVFEPGVYILDGIDLDGCVQYGIARIAVTFLETPSALITGPKTVCVDEPFQLYGRPVFENTYQYSWQLDSQPMPQWDDIPIITQSLSSSGNYTYTLTVTTPSGCTDTTTFIVEVFNLPEPPSAGFAIEACDPYTVNLYAQANEPGTFLWSDGQSGNSIVVTHGGPYRVTFINMDGCRSSTDIDVPHNPEAYIWVYPQGCYGVCEQNTNDLYVRGPVIPFSWEWQVDTNPINSGTGVMIHQYWTENGFYQLQLGDGMCAVTSPGFSWNMAESCDDCEIDIDVINIRAMKDDNDNCYFIVYIDINNNGIPLSYTIDNLSNLGVAIPGGGYLPTGTTNLELEFYPPDNFGGGNVDFKLIGTGIDELLNCLKDFSINFPPCPPNSLRPTGEIVSEEIQIYTVIPNPTTGNVYLSYPVDKNNIANKTLYIYDLLGREIKGEILHSMEGKTTIDIDQYATGTYLLIIRKEGNTVFYKRIILNK